MSDALKKPSLRDLYLALVSIAAVTYVVSQASWPFAITEVKALATLTNVTDVSHIVSWVGFTQVSWPVAIAIAGTTLVLALAGWVAFSSFIWQDEKQWKMLVGVKDTFLTQEIVDQKMRVLAIAFDNLCKAQVSLQSKNSSDSSLDTIVAEIAHLKSEIAIVKSAFWKAHELVGKLGFETHSPYERYLPDHMRK